MHVSGTTAMLSDSARATTEELFAMARAAGAVISFDPNVRHKLGSPDQWRTTVGPLLREPDLVFAGSDELELNEVTADELLAGRARLVVVKHPDKTAEVITADGSWRQETLAGTVVDPVGAGDALVAGYLSAWLRGSKPAEALRSGVLCAALVVGAVTDLEGLPSRAEHERLMRSAHGETVDR